MKLDFFYYRSRKLRVLKRVLVVLLGTVAAFSLVSSNGAEAQWTGPVAAQGYANQLHPWYFSVQPMQYPVPYAYVQVYPQMVPIQNVSAAPLQQSPISNAPLPAASPVLVAAPVPSNENASCVLETNFPAISVTIFGQANVGTFANDKQTICESLLDVPSGNADSLKRLTIRYGNQTDKGERGQAGGILMYINGGLPELRSLFYHELGHNVDSQFLQGNSSSGESVYTGNNDIVYNDDQSVGFYSISWSNAHVTKNATSTNFVSGYAKTNPEEDFAESYNFYVSEGNLFRAWAGSNAILKQKYDWLKNNVFGGKEYSSGPNGFAGRPWDGTRMR